MLLASVGYKRCSLEKEGPRAQRLPAEVETRRAKTWPGPRFSRPGVGHQMRVVDWLLASDELLQMTGSKNECYSIPAAADRCTDLQETWIKFHQV
jgi:hypothetical protein